MSATIMQYWDHDADAAVTCPSCGWAGPSRGLGDLHDDFFDVTCPTCDTMLLIVNYPTLAETQAAAAAGNRRAQDGLADIEEKDRAHREWKRRVSETMLRATSALPNLDGDQLVIDWDFEEHDNDQWTILRHGGVEIWREVAFWDGIGRFAEVAEILRARYGTRPIELRPTPASELWLWGDKLHAPHTVDDINAKRRRGD